MEGPLHRLGREKHLAPLEANRKPISAEWRLTDSLSASEGERAETATPLHRSHRPSSQTTAGRLNTRLHKHRHVIHTYYPEVCAVTLTQARTQTQTQTQSFTP